MRKLKLFFMLLPLFLFASQCLGQNGTNKNYTCVADTNKQSLEAALYLLIPDSSKMKGFNVFKTKYYYCISTGQRISLQNIDTVYKEFNEHYKLFNLNFHFNKIGSELLSDFTRHHSGEKIGLFINNKLLTAASIFGEIDSGTMTLLGNFTEAEIDDFKNQILKVLKK